MLHYFFKYIISILFLFSSGEGKNDVCMNMRITLRPKTVIQSLRSISLCRNLCKKNEETAQNFVPVYKFPYILPFSLINRLKIYQTALAVASLPGAAIMSKLNYLPSDAVQFAAVLGASGCLTLYTLGYLTTKFIGFIYYNEKNDTVKISFVDFWGKRKDIIIPAADVVPLDELPVTPLNGLFLTFRRFSTNETLRLNLKYGIILDKEKLKKIF